MLNLILDILIATFMFICCMSFFVLICWLVSLFVQFIGINYGYVAVSMVVSFFVLLVLFYLKCG